MYYYTHGYNNYTFKVHLINRNMTYWINAQPCVASTHCKVVRDLWSFLPGSQFALEPYPHLQRAHADGRREYVCSTQPVLLVRMFSCLDGVAVQIIIIAWVDVQLEEARIYRIAAFRDRRSRQIRWHHEQSAGWDEMREISALRFQLHLLGKCDLPTFRVDAVDVFLF